MAALLRKTLLDRLKGTRPSALRALLVAIMAGIAAGWLTYKALRA